MGTANIIPGIPCWARQGEKLQPNTSSAKQKNGKKTAPCVVRQYTHGRKREKDKRDFYIFSNMRTGTRDLPSRRRLRCCASKEQEATCVHTSIRISNHNNETRGVINTDSPEPPTQATNKYTPENKNQRGRQRTKLTHKEPQKARDSRTTTGDSSKDSPKRPGSTRLPTTRCA